MTPLSKGTKRNREMRNNGQRNEGVSTGLAEMLGALGPVEREELAALLRQPNTFLAEDMDDLVAILTGLGE